MTNVGLGRAVLRPKHLRALSQSSISRLTSAAEAAQTPAETEYVIEVARTVAWNTFDRKLEASLQGLFLIDESEATREAALRLVGALTGGESWRSWADKIRLLWREDWPQNLPEPPSNGDALWADLNRLIDGARLSPAIAWGLCLVVLAQTVRYFAREP